ncbi:MAG: SirA-like protein [Spirochaetes bacterium ADurb.Bin218]|jgi:TusA-related sulfurtransferase|nr:sulfurtransferase TusA family protein [Spirochaetota bacterium]OQB00473.1 MAG: SirA-like protein [Spirochaetes bacterium ADurb.Bin218]HOV09428.1 sulfurtransferase TusA family protein [Spirochaetota bacterium]HPX92156.1 sulfurtransferase TusA family protein [Spirochaetota bacterium]
MSDKIDARGLSCPQPVVLTQKAIKDGKSNFEILVDTEVSRENVLRCLEKNNFNAAVSEDGDIFIIKASKK